MEKKGQMKGASIAPSRLHIGSTVVYKTSQPYKNSKVFLKKDERYTVSGIYDDIITLLEVPNEIYDIEDFFVYFTQIKT